MTFVSLDMWEQNTPECGERLAVEAHRSSRTPLLDLQAGYNAAAIHLHTLLFDVDFKVLLLFG